MMGTETNMSAHLEQASLVKRAMKNSWMAGDFGVIAQTIAGSGQEFVDRLQAGPGTRALDVASGTGNLAIPLAQRGASVTGLDIATNLLEQARKRAVSEKLDIRFDEGDAEQMPYADGAFNLVVTMFGAMFAPRPDLVASELARVLEPGGRLAMANWNPESFSGKMFRVGSKHAPPPSGMPPPVLWGDPKTAIERLTPYFDNIKTRLIPIDFDLPMDAAGTVAFFRKFFGPTNVAFSRLDSAGQDAFQAELEELWSDANVASDPAKQTLVRNEYLQVTAIKR